MDFILTIDIGTTSSKALLVSPHGEVAASAQEFYPTHFPRPGYAEQEPAQVLSAVRKIIKTITRSSPHPIECLSFSCAMHSILGVDKQGQPLTPIILWSDMRSWHQSKAIGTGSNGDLIYFRTGTPIHPMSPLCKLLWMREREPATFLRAHKFVSIKEFVLHYLCGSFMIDYSLASSTGFFDVHRLEWSVEAMEEIGVEREKLSPCVSPYHRIDSIRKEVAADLGLPAQTSVIVGGSDGCLAHLGSQAMNPGDLSITIGTSGAVRMASPTYARDPKKRIFNYRLDEQTFISGGATNNGTILINWFQGIFGPAEEASVESFVAGVQKIPPGAEGLVFLPYVFGERAPYYNPDFRGAFLGLAQNHTRQHLMRGLLEGICYEIRSMVDSVEEAVGSVNRVLASGGFIRSEAWVQMLANVLGREILLRDVHDASSLGAARIACKACGVHADFRDSSTGKVFYPDGSVESLYTEMYAIFSKTTESLATGFEMLGQVRRSSP